MEVYIAEAAPKDALSIIALNRGVLAEPDVHLTLPEEYNPSTDDVISLIRTRMESVNSVLFVAKEINEVVGILGLEGGVKFKTSHVAQLGMSVSSRHRRRGIGSMLVETAIAWAQHNDFIKKLELSVIAINFPAIALYCRLGFIEEGRSINGTKSGNGYADLIRMALFV